MPKINSSSMAELLGGLTVTAGDGPLSAPVAPAPVSRRGRKPLPQKKERVCTIVSQELMAKIRTIADREGISITDLFDLALSVLVRNYEQKHGAIKVRAPKKNDITDVFDL